jgi:hypothetical protein
MTSVLPPAPVPTPADPAPPSDTAAAASMGWVAGPVLGGVALLAICGAAYWRMQRRAAQAAQRRYQFDGTTIEGSANSQGLRSTRVTAAAREVDPAARAQALLQEWAKI